MTTLPVVPRSNQTSRSAAELLISGGHVVDGTGRPAFRADISARDGVIAEVGPRLSKSSDTRVVDASGCTVVPGFIDSHTHFDAAVFWDPYCDPMPQHGVTTVVAGNCSLSLAPITERVRSDLYRVFSYVEDYPAGLLDAVVPTEWSSFDEYWNHMKNTALGVNFASFVGHSALRLAVMGPDAWERPATEEERFQLGRVLADCLDCGAMGLSMSFFDEDNDKRPVPSRIADQAELDILCDVVANRDALLTFIPNVAVHGELMSDVGRVAEICRRTGAVATWNGLFYDERNPNRSREILSQAEGFISNGLEIYPQVTPRSQDIRINWRGGMAFYSLEAWHQVLQATDRDKYRLLTDPTRYLSSNLRHKSTKSSVLHLLCR